MIVSKNFLDAISPHRLRGILVIVLLVANGLFVAMAWHTVQRSKQQYEARARVETQNLVNGISTNVTNSIEKIDLALRAVIDEIDHQFRTRGKVDERTLDTLIARHLQRLPELDAIRVADAQGFVFLGKGVKKETRASWADRDYFTFLRDHPEHGLWITKPLFGRVAQKYIIGLNRRYNRPDGSFAGVISAPLAVDHFTELLSRYQAGANGTLILRDAEEALITRHPPIPNKPVGQVGHRGVSPELQKLFDSRVKEQTYHTPLGADGIERIVTFKRLENPPFIVIAGVASSDYLASWNHETRNIVWFVAGFAALSFVSAFLLLHLLNRLLRDIEARKQTEARLAASELQLSTIIETEPECVKLLSPDGRLLQMNRAGLGMVEADSFEQVANRFIVEVVAPEYRDAFSALNTRVAQGESGTLEFELIGLKGGHRWLETHAVPIRDIQGQVSSLLSVTRDVTARKQNEQALLEAKQVAEAANLAKSQFLATMSHEIRTPMNGVLGMAQLLLMPDLTEEERQKYARTILNSGQTLLALLNDILDLSKVDAGKLRLVSKAFEPRQLIEETVALFAESAHEKSLGIEAAWDGNAPSEHWSDPVRLRQMLSNYVSNAIKFTERGQIRVSGQVDAQDPDLIRFTVTDTGIGIAPEYSDRLFKPFSQVDSSDSRRFGGTGLGLSIVRSLAHLMGGAVGMDSQPGQGASFWFSVRAPRLVGDHENRDRQRTLLPLPATDSPLASGCRILVAEDNHTNQLVIAAALKKYGYAFTITENGEEALSTATQDDTRPDLLLMDCQMPVMNGFEATSRIRAWEAERQAQRLPIVALTAGAFEEDRQHCLAAGMDDYLAKPVDIQQLHAMLQKWLEKAPASATPPTGAQNQYSG